MFKNLMGSLFGAEEEKKPAQQEQVPVQSHHVHTATHNDVVASAMVMEQDDDDTVELDPTTLHGTHYTLEEFDAEVEERVQAWIASEKEDGDDPSPRDIENFYFNFRRAVYQDWTGADLDQVVQWEHVNSMQHRGQATMGYAQADAGNALLEPIHGISLEDYAAIALKLSSGADLNAVCRAMGIESAVWQEVNTLWTKRMQEDSTFQVVTLYGQYFSTAGNHPKLRDLGGAAVSAAGADNLEKIKTDRYFYEELCGARQAAYEYGLDGAQWIQDQFGISLGEFQSVASQYAIEQNQNWNSEQIMAFFDYQQAKQKEYAARFAAEQGGNVADDVEF